MGKYLKIYRSWGVSPCRAIAHKTWTPWSHACYKIYPYNARTDNFFNKHTSPAKNQHEDQILQEIGFFTFHFEQKFNSDIIIQWRTRFPWREEEKKIIWIQNTIVWSRNPRFYLCFTCIYFIYNSDTFSFSSKKPIFHSLVNM